MGEISIDLPKEDMVLLKESGLYFFLLCRITAKTEPLMEWETVLPQKVRKLASVIEENDAVLALTNDDL